ncbi:MAG TPA: GNAT family N-acetyltransferase [Rhodocyclaceae bacterium]|nr:GNAT family N-acetyltransferase [Rhodocyclaceae bacterium]
MSLQIRPYRSDDLAELAELFTMAVHLLGRPHYDAMQLAAWAPMPPDLDEWANCFTAVNTLIMENTGCPLGFVSWRDDGKAGGYISHIFVRPDAARKGIASRLLAAAETALPDAGMIHVHASLVARPFFEKHGYAVVKEETAVRAGLELTRFEMRKTRVA